MPRKKATSNEDRLIGENNALKVENEGLRELADKFSTEAGLNSQIELLTVEKNRAIDDLNSAQIRIGDLRTEVQELKALVQKLTVQNDSYVSV